MVEMQGPGPPGAGGVLQQHGVVLAGPGPGVLGGGAGALVLGQGFTPRSDIASTPPDLMPTTPTTLTPPSHSAPVTPGVMLVASSSSAPHITMHLSHVHTLRIQRGCKMEVHSESRHIVVLRRGQFCEDDDIHCQAQLLTMTSIAQTGLMCWMPRIGRC